MPRAMLTKDSVIQNIDDVLSGVGGFIRDGYLQINGETTLSNIEQISLTDSEFSFDYRNKRILHFTSMEALQLILESKALRASNLNRFKDKLEFVHALDCADIASDKFKEDKKHKFALSFTPHDRPIEDRVFHWGQYADSHKGVALEIEIDSTKLPFDMFSLQTNYVKEAYQSPLISRIADMGLDPVTIRALTPLFCGIKDECYADEEEVRIFIDGDKNVIEAAHFDVGRNYQMQIDDHGEPIYYCMLPLIFPAEEATFDKFLRLRTIYLGKQSSYNFGIHTEKERLYEFCENNNLKYVDLY